MEETVYHIIAFEDETKRILYIIVGLLAFGLILYAVSLMTLPSSIAHAIHQVSAGSVQGQMIGEHNTVNQYYS